MTMSPTSTSLDVIEIEKNDARATSRDAKAAKLDFNMPISGGTWWDLVPRTFLGLVLFCFVFAMISLVGVAVFAEETSSSSGKTSSGFLLFVGIVSSIIGSLQTACGYCCQRLGHQLESASRSNKKSSTNSVPTAAASAAGETNSPSDKSQTSNPLVFIGLLLLACGTIAAIVNLGILGQSVTAPFAAMTLIFNGCLACTVLREAVTKVDIVATVLVLFGVGVAMLGVTMATLEVQQFVLTDFERIFFRSWFPLLYSLTMLFLLVGSYTYVARTDKWSSWAGLSCFSVGAGVLSGFSSLCVKCTVELAKGAAQNRSNDLENPITYLFALGIPICVLAQLKLMSLGLQHFGTLKFVPPYHAFIILSNLINGMVYFDESKGYDAVSAALFIIGCAVTIAGVLLLLAKVPRECDHDPTSPSAAGRRTTSNASPDSTATSNASCPRSPQPILGLHTDDDEEDTGIV
ncbi:TPA: hypothetical protein N0F65_005795 [Lagenidium giganteum]|uniref:Uncharacterized protein n=1 Tax=Lagenidium giganteum TaxID=4803 RepID=A0AAV2YF28_9STRA|nr:TPA: hypothetical protein N0F65_005795 [Lagenidium giganteum]